MKTLIIIRHAKSSWDNLALSDFDRPLNDRGERDAPRMGKRLKEKNITPDLMLSSPAKRALDTCKKIAKILGYKEDLIKTDPNLYHADGDEIRAVVHKLKDAHKTVLIFGHNPGLTDFVNSMTNARIDNVPTCGVVAFKCNVARWHEVKFGCGKLVFYDYPKSRKD